MAEIAGNHDIYVPILTNLALDITFVLIQEEQHVTLICVWDLIVTEKRGSSTASALTRLPCQVYRYSLIGEKEHTVHNRSI